MKFDTKSENPDVQDIARMSEEITNEDWYFGPLEDKLKLIVRLAERLADDAAAATTPKFDPEMIDLAIQSGMVDHRLDVISSVIDRRKSLLATEKLASLTIGQRITISDSVTPKLLAGCPCEVVGFETGDKVKVRLLATRSYKWQLNQIVTLPKSLIGD